MVLLAVVGWLPLYLDTNCQGSLGPVTYTPFFGIRRRIFFSQHQSLTTSARFGTICSVAPFEVIFSFPFVDLIFELCFGPEGSFPSYGSSTWLWTKSFSACMLFSKFFPFVLGCDVAFGPLFLGCDALIDCVSSKTLGTSLSGFTCVDIVFVMSEYDPFELFGVFSNKLGTSLTENICGSSTLVSGWLTH